MSLYEQMMRGGVEQLQDRTQNKYDVTLMLKQYDNVVHNIYPKSLAYLTDTKDKTSRHLKLETLLKFKVGLG